MKTQKIVLALALAAVTPAVLAAQENGNAYNKSTNEVIASNNQQTASLYVGPGSKIGYIADNALARIRKSSTEKQQQKEQQKQEPVQNKQNDTTNTYASVPAYYPYGGREGHMLVRDDVHKNKETKHHKVTTNKKTNTTKKTNDTTTHAATTSYDYTGIEGHRAAGFGNAVRDAKRGSTSVPTIVRDIDTVSKNHEVTLNSKAADKSAKKTNKTFRDSLGEYGKQVLEAFQNNANAGK